MTVRDTLLTAHTGERGTIAALHVRAQLAALEHMGLDGDQLLANAELSRAMLDDPDARVTEQAHSRIVRAALSLKPAPSFALELAAHVPMGAYEVVDYLVLSSDTVLAGMHQLARYFRLISDTLLLQVTDHEGGARLVVSASDGTPPPRFAVEYFIAITLLNLARATDKQFKPSQVSFMHRVEDAASFERQLACSLACEQPWNGFAAPHDAWALAMPKRDPTLRRVLEHHAQSLTAQLPEARGIAADVRREIAALLPTGEVRIANVARKLGLSPRTLQRQLAEHGCVFQDMVEDVLRALAERYLRDTKLSIGEVAYLLGYSEPSAFHRAFRRWFDMTPDAFRRSTPRSVPSR